MTVFLIILAVLLVLFLLFLLMLRGRTGQAGIKKLQGWSYAHRGLHGNGIPENSMAAFSAALEHGYGIELDVHLLADGSLAIMHDSKMIRTTGQDVVLETLTAEQLDAYRLEGTDEKVPFFRQVLDLFQGKAPMIVELKSHDNNYAELTEAVCKMLDSYDGVFCLESFDPRCVLWLKKHRPDLIRGQLAQDFTKEKFPVPYFLCWCATYNLCDFITSPDFLAYRYSDRKNMCNLLCRNLWKIQGVSWTLKTPEEYETAVKEGWIPIFEGFDPKKDCPSAL